MNLPILMLSFIILYQPEEIKPPKLDGLSENQKGDVIFKYQQKRDEGFKSSQVSMSMTLYNAAGESSQRQMLFKTLEVADEGDKTLMIFEKPSDVKGTALLTYEHIKSDDDQWLYLPSLKKTKRISASDKTGSFMGSEFSYEDLASFEIEKFTYKLLKEEKYENMDCWIIERIPKVKESGYSKIISWVDKENYLVRKSDFYNKAKEHLKTMLSLDYKKYNEVHWRPGTIEMVNKLTKKKTILQFDKWKLKLNLSSSDFTKQKLEEGD